MSCSNRPPPLTSSVWPCAGSEGESVNAAVTPKTGRKNYNSVIPKCGIYYRDGRHAKVGLGSHTGAGRALSSSSATGLKQKIYEYVGGEIVLERSRAKGSTGIHVSMNPTQEMFSVNTPHSTPFDTLYPHSTDDTPIRQIIPPFDTLYPHLTDNTHI